VGGKGAGEVGRGEGLADSNNSMKDTWNELKIWSVERSHRRYALEWGAYPMRVQGMERWLTVYSPERCISLFTLPHLQNGRASLFSEDAMFTLRRWGGKVDFHILDGVGTGHINYGLRAAVSKMFVPGINVWYARCVMSI
jgi:hypothetical protein